MAKKPRSQRRKKGQALGNDDTDDINHHDSGIGVDELSESHTIADSMSVYSSGVSSAFDEEFGGDDSTSNDDDEYWFKLKKGTGGPSDRSDAAVAAAGRLMRLQDALVGLDEYASDKRSKAREATLRKVFRALSQYGTGAAAVELVNEQSEWLRNACWHGIRAGDPPEQYAACRVLEVASLFFGNDLEWAESLDRQLRRVVMTTTRAIPVRMAALRAFSMAVFVGSNGEDTVLTESLMDLCEQSASPEFRNETVPLPLRATALDCWSLLATTIGNFDLAGQDDEQMGRGLSILSLLKHCLETTSVELRSAAGECVSLIHEARLALGIEHDQGENVTARRYRRGSWDGSQWEVLMDEVKQRIAELSVESGHHMSKKAKKEQRATFREFMATIVEDEAPEESVSFRNNGTLTLTSWREIIQLNFVRHCLQGGFQLQLLTNPTLQAIFGANGQFLGETQTASLSQLEKRLVWSKTSEASKKEDLDMTRQRRKRENIKNHFLTADGDDI